MICVEPSCLLDPCLLHVALIPLESRGSQSHILSMAELTREKSHGVCGGGRGLLF